MALVCSPKAEEATKSIAITCGVTPHETAAGTHMGQSSQCPVRPQGLELLLEELPYARRAPQKSAGVHTTEILWPDLGLHRWGGWKVTHDISQHSKCQFSSFGIVIPAWLEQHSSCCYPEYKSTLNSPSSSLHIKWSWRTLAHETGFNEGLV